MICYATYYFVQDDHSWIAQGGNSLVLAIKGFLQAKIMTWKNCFMNPACIDTGVI